MTEPAENKPYRVRRAQLMILGGVYDTPAAIDELAGRLLPDIQELPPMAAREEGNEGRRKGPRERGSKGSRERGTKGSRLRTEDS